VRGSDRLHPEVNLTATLGAGARLRLGRRLLAFARDLVAGLLEPLELPDADRLGPAARGLLYQLQQSLGSVAADSVRDQLAALTGQERRRLREAGLVLGPLAVFHPALLSPEALDQRRALCAAERWPDPLPVPADGHPRTLPAHPELPARVYQALGYVLQGPRALRADHRPGPRRKPGPRSGPR
jgi:ATP-dependent RNA helicase SUPV3L1/SUV3